MSTAIRPQPEVLKYICVVYLVENDTNAMSKKEAEVCVEAQDLKEAIQVAAKIPIKELRP